MNVARTETTSVPSLSRPAGPALRFRAQALDTAVIAGWVGFAAAVGLGLRTGGISLDSAWARDAVAFTSLVLPSTLTFAASEASMAQATFGKRRLNLIVTDREGNRVSFRRSLARSALKFLPWQLAHTAVFGLLADPTSKGFLFLSIGAQALVVVSVFAMILDPEHPALHDRVAGTRVIR
jgi:uncharacterized RDD family membrane protein YckC